MIFSPSWFARHDVVSQTEADAAENIFNVPEFTHFKMGPKTITVEPTRFSVETAQAPWVAICDLTMKTFGELLPHTPLRQMGINRQVHFGVGSEEIRNRIGRTLAPTEPWGEWGAKIENSPADLRGGFSSLTMQESWRDGVYRGHVQARAEPSLQIEGNSGIFMQVNYHSQLIEAGAVDASEKILAFLNKNFEREIKYSEWIIDQIMKLKEELGP